MKHLALIAALSTIALPAVAQGIYVPDGGSRSIYGGRSGPPTYHYQQMAPPMVPPQPAPPPRSTVCTTYGNQTFCN